MPIGPSGEQLPYPEDGGMATAPESPSDILKPILDALDLYRHQEQSQQNLLLVEKIRTLVQQILTNEEREMDGMLQGKFSPGATRRFAGGL